MELGHLQAPAASGDGTYLGWMLSGLQVTIALSLSAWVIAGPGQPDGRAAHRAGQVAVGHRRHLRRGLPQHPAAGAALHLVLRAARVLPFGLGERFKQELDPLTQQFVSAMVCLAFFTSARVCEQVRSGINALPRGQKNAGLALGFTCPRPTAMCSCRWLSAWWCRRSRPSF
jgi:glutamate/aspartate transport system permease protein